MKVLDRQHSSSSKSIPDTFAVGTTSNNFVTLDEELVNTYPFMPGKDLLKCIMNEKNDTDKTATEEYRNLIPRYLNAIELLAAIEKKNH